MKTYLYRLTDSVNNLKLTSRVEDVGHREKDRDVAIMECEGGSRCTELPLWQSNRGKNSYNMVVEYERHKRKRDVLEGEMRDVNRGGKRPFDTFKNSEKMIAILGDR